MGLVLTIFNEGAYLTLTSIFHKTLLLLCLGSSSSGYDRSATIASRLFGSDLVFYMISSSPMTASLTDIRLSDDEMFLSRKPDGVGLEILAFTSFNTSIQRVGWARFARNINNSSTLVNRTILLFLWRSVSQTNMQHKNNWLVLKSAIACCFNIDTHAWTSVM